MALDAPAPLAGLGRSAEDGEEIPAGLADHGPTFFQFEENGFEAHDGGGGDVAGVAGARLDQGRAAFFWSGSMSSRGTPLRVDFLFLSCRGMKNQLVRSLLSKE